MIWAGEGDYISVVAEYGTGMVKVDIVEIDELPATLKATDAALEAMKGVK